MVGHRSIESSELKQWLDEGRSFVLLDVLPNDVYQSSHLPTAHNACIYEIGFLDEAASHAADKEACVVVYCSGPGSRASTDAAERLVGAGYSDVREFEGGREGWHDAGYGFEGEYDPPPPAAAAELRDRVYTVDIEKSIVGWVGRNLGGSHDGTLRLDEGRVVVADGAITKATFRVDMESLKVDDLDGEMADLLAKHLGSDDFFGVSEHKHALFSLTEISAIDGATPGAPNFNAAGTLTMRGETPAPVSFPAMIGARADGELALDAHFDIDRTQWGVNYGSGKLYTNLGLHLVNDHVSIQIRVIAR